MESQPRLKQRRFQFSLRALLVFIAAVSLALAAMRIATPGWASGAVSVTVGVFVIAIAIGIGSSGVRRVFWVAFAACGSAYLIVTMSFHQEFVEQLVTSKIVAAARDAFHPPSDFTNGPIVQTPPPLVSRLTSGTPGIVYGEWLVVYGDDYAIMNTNFVLIGQCIWSLILAMLGGSVGRIVARTATRRQNE